MLLHRDDLLTEKEKKREPYLEKKITSSVHPSHKKRKKKEREGHVFLDSRGTGQERGGEEEGETENH